MILPVDMCHTLNRQYAAMMLTRAAVYVVSVALSSHASASICVGGRNICLLNAWRQRKEDEAAINQSNNQSTNQSTIHQSINQLNNHSINQSSSQSIKRSVNQASTPPNPTQTCEMAEVLWCHLSHPLLTCNITEAAW